MQVTGFGYDHGPAWQSNMELFKELTDVSQVQFCILHELDCHRYTGC